MASDYSCAPGNSDSCGVESASVCVRRWNPLRGDRDGCGLGIRGARRLAAAMTRSWTCHNAPPLKASGRGACLWQEQERFLASFARHAEAQGERFVRVEACLDWASRHCVTAMHSAARRITGRHHGSCRWNRSARSWTCGAGPASRRLHHAPLARFRTRSAPRAASAHTESFPQPDRPQHHRVRTAQQPVPSAGHTLRNS